MPLTIFPLTCDLAVVCEQQRSNNQTLRSSKWYLTIIGYDHHKSNNVSCQNKSDPFFLFFLIILATFPVCTEKLSEIFPESLLTRWHFTRSYLFALYYANIRHVTRLQEQAKHAFLNALSALDVHTWWAFSSQLIKWGGRDPLQAIYWCFLMCCPLHLNGFSKVRFPH